MYRLCARGESLLSGLDLSCASTCARTSRSVVKLRRVPKRKPTFLEAHEVAPVLTQIAERWQPFFATAIYTGLRKGELIGLRKRDVDVRRGLLTVRSRAAAAHGSAGG
jgi:integrase